MAVASGKRREIDWVTAGFLVFYHVAVLVGLPWYLLTNTPSSGVVVASIVLLFLSEIGIGAAYHRFYAHRAYRLSRWAEAPLLFLATLATQGSALRWSNDHRKHHSYVDTDDDPYAITKGFWYAHILWLFYKAEPIDERRVRDLLANPLVRFQHSHVLALTIGSNALVCGLVGLAFGDLLGAFCLAWWTRLFVSHHLTWFVNSLAHTWGERTYSREYSAVDNYVLALLTVGEGYHNYHHTFASDYRNGVRWYHFDPVKWTVWSLSRLGLAWDLRRFSSHRIRRRLVSEDRRLLLEALADRARSSRANLERRVERLAAALESRLARLAALAEELGQLKERGARRAERIAARRELRLARARLRREWRAWTRLCGLVLAPAPATV